MKAKTITSGNQLGIIVDYTSTAEQNAAEVATCMSILDTIKTDVPVKFNDLSRAVMRRALVNYIESLCTSHV